MVPVPGMINRIIKFWEQQHRLMVVANSIAVGNGEVIASLGNSSL
ncbi:hypothetical protein [Nostoc sp. KVJ3]|nr:hypothetical protein [Nostoc sp. KVJ3]